MVERDNVGDDFMITILLFNHISVDHAGSREEPVEDLLLIEANLISIISIKVTFTKGQE